MNDPSKMPRDENWEGEQAGPSEPIYLEDFEHDVRALAKKHGDLHLSYSKEDEPEHWWILTWPAGRDIGHGATLEKAMESAWK